MYHSRFKGTHYEAGFHYGELLLKNGKSLYDVHLLNLSDEKKRFCEKCIGIYQKEYPEILEEIRGIADGQGMPFEDPAEFILGMYNFAIHPFCTCFVCQDKNKIIFGRNSDFLVSLEPGYESCFYQLDHGFSFIGNTTAMVQMEDGVNEYGLAAGLTFIYPTVKKPGLNAGILVRYLLEKCKTVAEALEALRKLTISSSQTLTIADKSGKMIVVECNAEKMAVIEPKPDEHFVVTTNDFNSKTMKPYRCTFEDDLFSGLRYDVAYRSLKNSGGYSLEYAKDLLSGKFGFMCQYDRNKGADTVWSSIYLLDENKIYRCEGNPSRKKYQEDKRLKFR